MIVNGTLTVNGAMEANGLVAAGAGGAVAIRATKLRAVRDPGMPTGLGRQGWREGEGGRLAHP